MAVPFKSHNVGQEAKDSQRSQSERTQRHVEGRRGCIQGYPRVDIKYFESQSIIHFEAKIKHSGILELKSTIVNPKSIILKLQSTMSNPFESQIGDVEAKITYFGAKTSF